MVTTTVNHFTGDVSYEWVQRWDDATLVTIREQAFAQLESRVSTVANNEWMYTDENLMITVFSEDYPESTTVLDGNSSPNVHYYFTRARNEWLTNTDPSSENVSIEKFYETNIRLIETWLRTAVFYCVGSYER